MQCPFGFATFPVHPFHVAITGLVPFPRLGGVKERLRARQNPRHRISQEAIERARTGLLHAHQRLIEAQIEVAQKQSVALHEIRKLNRTVKQTAERLCRDNSPHDLDNAPPHLVRIWKTAELMSYQFEILELLANESLADLPVKTDSEVYRLLDKVVRIYRPEKEPERLALRSNVTGSLVVRVCDKTFSIIPTVLIENALKHSPKRSIVDVELRTDGDNYRMSVSSYAEADHHITEAVFERGVRGNTAVEGSGHGLHLAQLVARQHGTLITVKSEKLTAQTQRVTFSVKLVAVRPPV